MNFPIKKAHSLPKNRKLSVPVSEALAAFHCESFAFTRNAPQAVRSNRGSRAAKEPLPGDASGDGTFADPKPAKLRPPACRQTAAWNQHSGPTCGQTKRPGFRGNDAPKRAGQSGIQCLAANARRAPAFVLVWALLGLGIGLGLTCAPCARAGEAAAVSRLETGANRTLVLSGGTPIYTSARPGTPVYRAVLALQRDMQKVLGQASPIKPLTQIAAPGLCVVDSGDDHEIAPLAGWEAHRVFAGELDGKPQIVLQGADLRGTIYAIYTFSEKILGVPPLWYFCGWQATPTNSIRIPATLDIRVASPTVKYRGWFPNDMDLLSQWRKLSPENNVMWLEAALRLKINTIQWGDAPKDYSQPYSISPTARLIHEYGLVNTAPHNCPVNSDLRQWDDYWKNVRHTRPPALALTNAAQLEEFWRYNIESAVTNQLEMLWVIGFRGVGDNPFWTAFKDSPAAMKARGEVISRMTALQRKMVLDLTGNANSQFQTFFYNECSDLLAKGYLHPPADPHLIWTYVAARRDHYPNDDVQQVPAGSDRHLGYYFNYQFTSTGSHLAPAEGPWKMERNFRYVASKSRYPLAFAVVNAGNIREFVCELSAFADMMWYFDQYHTDDFLQNYCATYFGADHAAAIAKLYQEYYHAFWQPKHNELPFMERQFVFQDLRYKQAIRSLCKVFNQPYNPNPLHDLGNEQVKGRTYRIVPADNGATDQIGAIIHGTKASAARFQAVGRAADKIYLELPAANRPFFNDNLRAFAHYLYHLNECLLHLARAYQTRSSDTPARGQLLATAKDEFRAAETAIRSTAHGQFQDWYHGDWIFDLRGTRRALDRLEP
jgi:hypothetical protein